MALDVGEVVATLKADTSKFASGIDAANRKLDDLGGSFKQSTGKIESFLSSGAIVGVGGLITAKLTDPLIGFGQAAVESASKLEQATIAYTTLLGSGEAAQKMLNEMRAFAASTPFEFPDLLEAGKRMLAMGFDAKNLIPTLTNVGNAVAAIGGDAGMMNRVILAMGQIQAKGQLMAGEMRQLAEAGIPAWEFLAKELGVTVPQAMDMVTKKQVSGAQALTALQAGMAEKFGGLMEQQSKTVQGMMSNLHDSVGFIMTDIGTEIIKTLNLKGIISEVQGFAQSFLEWFRSLDDGTKKTILVLTGAFAASGPILIAVGAFMAAMTLITAPMLAGGAIITGLIAAVGVVIVNWNSFKEKAIALWTGLRDGVVKIATDTVNGIKQWFTDKLMALVQPVQKFADNVLGIFKKLRYELVGGSEVPDMVEEIGDHMRMLDKNMVAPARTAARGTFQVFRDLAGQVSSTMAEISNTMISTWANVTSTMSNALATQIIKGNDWRATMENLSISVLSSFINLGLQMLTQAAIREAAYVGLMASHGAVTLAAATEETAINTAKNAEILASDTATAGGLMAIWTSTSAAVTGSFALMGTGIQTLFAETIMPMFIQLGTAVEAFLTAIAGSLDISIFGAPFSIPVWAAVGLIAAAIGAIAAFSFGAFAEGGVVTKPMMGLVGEAGPEAIIPLSQLGGMMGSGPQTITVELDGRTLAKSTFDNMPSVVRLRGIGRA